MSAGDREAWQTACGPGAVLSGSLDWMVVGSPLPSHCNILECCGNHGESTRSVLCLVPKSTTVRETSLSGSALYSCQETQGTSCLESPMAYFSGLGGHFLEVPGPKTPFFSLLHDFPFRNGGHWGYTIQHREI